MIVKPWAKAIAAIPGRPTPSPTTAAAPAPMNTNAKVPMNSARSLGAREVDIADLQRQAWADRLGATSVAAQSHALFAGGRRHGRAAAGRRSDRRYSAATICG